MGMELPDDDDDKLADPEFLPGAEYFWTAFGRLSKSRHIGFGVGPIPFLAMDDYCQRYGYDNIDEFESIIIPVDEEFLRLESEAAKPKGEDNTDGQSDQDSSGRRGSERGFAHGPTKS